MLCSNCSETIRPVVALDIDGVLGDYHAHFLRFAVPYFGFDMEKLLEMSLARYDGSEPFREYCARMLDVTVMDYRNCKLAYRQGGLKRSMPLNDGAYNLCHNTRKYAELWLTTTRPYLALDGVIKDTTFWLDLWGIEYDGLLFDDDKYNVLAERIDPKRVTAVVDDIDEMYDSAAALFGPAIPLLYLNTYNDAMGEGRNCRSSLKFVTEWVMEAVAEWRGQYV